MGGWLLTSGNAGWRNDTYGGGFYMNDNVWIRTYGDKNFLHNTGIMRTNGVFQVGDNGNRFLVNQNGNVGIGGVANNAKLYVNGIINTSTLPLVVGTDKPNEHPNRLATFYDNSMSGSTKYLNFGKYGSFFNCGELSFSHVSDNSSDNYVSLGLYASSSRLNIDGDGNVGFGGDYGHVNDCGELSFTQVCDNCPLNYVSLGIYGSSSRLNIDGAGNVGIGTDAPKHKLEVHGRTAIGQYTNGTAVIDAYNSFAFLGCNAPENGIAVGPTGNVGIGLTKPSFKLEVKSTEPSKWAARFGRYSAWDNYVYLAYSPGWNDGCGMHIRTNNIESDRYAINIYNVNEKIF